MTSLAQALRGAFFFVVLFSLLIVINIAQTLSMIILPFSRTAFRAFNRGCAAFWWGLCVILEKKVNKARLILTGDELPMRENAIVIANHQEMSDILVVMMLALSKGRIGDLKWFVKDILKYVPGVGWGMLFLDCLFVKRNWDADKDKIHAVFSKFQTYNIPIWLISFVEGTRITESKKMRSQKYAKEQGLPLLEHVLMPRTKGFCASVQGLKAHVEAVYDLTIIYPQGVPSFWHIMKGSNNEFRVHVRRYEVNKLPSGQGELSQWLIDRFVEKDRLFESRHTIRSEAIS